MTSTIRVRRTADERRAEIADAARELALAEGLSAVTLRAVAARVGVASGLVAHYAPSMDELVASTFAGVVGDELGEVEQLVLAAPDAVTRLSVLMTTLLDVARDDVTRLWVQSWALGGGNEALAVEVRAQMDAWVRLIARVIAQGVSEGSFRVDDADAVARQLLGMLDGLSAHALVRWGDAGGRRELLARAVEAMVGADAGALSEHVSS